MYSDSECLDLDGKMIIHVKVAYGSLDQGYCHVPAGWGLKQTTLAPGSDKTRGPGSFGPLTGGPR